MSISEFNFNSMTLGDALGSRRVSPSFAEYHAARQAIKGATVKGAWHGNNIVSEITKSNALRVLDCLEATTRAPDITPKLDGTLSLGWETDQGYGHLDIGQTSCYLFVQPNASSPVECNGEFGVIVSTAGWALDTLLYPNLSVPLAHVQPSALSVFCPQAEDLYATEHQYRALKNLFSESIVQAFFNSSVTETLDITASSLLGSIYTMRGNSVERFIQEHHLFDVLMQARKPIESAFGPASVKTLTLVEDDEGEQTLFCLVMVSEDMQQARKALKALDQDWWIQQSPITGGKLNFDFELI